MTRSELTQKIAERNQDIDADLVEQASKMVLATILNGLVEGDRVEVRKFGSFSLRVLKPHVARNPKTGEKVPVGNRFFIYFRPGILLKDRINSGSDKSGKDES